MILAAMGFAGIGLWFLIAGDGPARIVGVGLLALAAGLAYLVWVAIAVERPAMAPQQFMQEVVLNG